MTRASCCEVCDTADPHWSITRRGDVATTWACDDHLASACAGLQRGGEVTELVVADSRKAVEWAAIHRSLERIAQEPGGSPPACGICLDTGQVWSADPDGESVSDQACPACDAPYPASGDPDAGDPFGGMVQ